MNDMNAISKAITESTIRQEKERQKWLLGIGEPDFFIADGENPIFGVGYWKKEDGSGVTAIRKMANGYHQKYSTFYPTEFIDILKKVNQ